jgi:nitrogen regulatory protein P-II 1
MKYVIGIVPPAALETVQAALGEAEIFRLTIAEVEVVSSGAVPGAASSAEMAPPDAGHARGGPLRALRLEIAVNDSFLAPALDAFERARAAGHAVMVSVLPLEDAVRIRTGERGSEAI